MQVTVVCEHLYGGNPNVYTSEIAPNYVVGARAFVRFSLGIREIYILQAKNIVINARASKETGVNNENRV